MLISKASLSLFFVISIAVVTTAAARTPCVSINIEAFNLLPDKNCSVSKSSLIQSELPDQVFLYDLGVPAEESCFVIIDPFTWDASVDGMISDPKTGKVVEITVSGVAGLTLNAYPPRPNDPPLPMSFTAATVVSVAIGNQDVGSLVTRDAGTIFADNNVAARLSIVAGTGIFDGAVGHIDEFGQEFNPSIPASAKGSLCGEELVKYFAGGDDDDDDDDDD